MGACLRSKETLALYLAPFFWKKLSGEQISWKNDFLTVDSAQVIKHKLYSGSSRGIFLLFILLLANINLPSSITFF